MDTEKPNPHATLPILSPDQERVVNLVIERAEQACRYALKHQTFERDDPAVESEYENGWTVAASVCEGAIRENVMRHIAEDIANAR